jgi:polysaccharide deacetylase 2 family uncharacterized protein YibQ
LKLIKTRLRHVTHAVPYHNRLDNAKGDRQQNRNNMITWKLQNKLEDIELADDVCLLIEKRNHMQKKLQKLETEARKTGLKINVKKTNKVRNRNEQISQIKIGNVDIEVQRVNYLEAVIERNGGSTSKEDVLTRMNKQSTVGVQPTGKHMEKKCSLNKHKGQNV